MDKTLWNLNDVYLKIKIKREKKTRIITSNRRSTNISLKIDKNLNDTRCSLWIRESSQAILEDIK